MGRRHVPESENRALSLRGSVLAPRSSPPAEEEGATWGLRVRREPTVPVNHTGIPVPYRSLMILATALRGRPRGHRSRGGARLPSRCRDLGQRQCQRRPSSKARPSITFPILLLPASLEMGWSDGAGDPQQGDSIKDKGASRQHL